MYDFRTLIVTSDTVDLAREIASELSPAGNGMWTTGLSQDGNEPCSHYISTGYIGNEFSQIVPLQVYSQETSEEGNQEWKLVESTEGSPEALVEACNSQGFGVKLEDVKHIFNTADVTTQDPFVAMQRLGLQMVTAVETSVETSVETQA